jgi:hypothetical protein
MVEKSKPVFDAFSGKRSEGKDDAFFRPRGAWPAEANNDAVSLVLNVLPINGRDLLLPHCESLPKKDSG